MKQRPGKHPDQATDIILCDKEMEELIQQLVKKAHDSGACVSHLTKAISSVWQEQFHVEFKPKELTKKEKAFAKKVKKFLSHYETNLIEFSRIISKRRYISYNQEYFHKLICSIYGTFQTEDTVKKDLIVKYAKEHGFKDPYFCCFMNDVTFLYNFISDHLYFNLDNSLPVYAEEWVGLDHSLTSVKAYNDFANQYILANTKTCKTAVGIIWLIETFF